MNETTSTTKKLINVFDRMWLDSLLSLQPSGTYREAWNAVTVADEENAFGISNEQANELFVDLPGEIRGMIYVEERDQYVVFIDTDTGGEIGIIDEKEQSYKSVTTTEIAPELGICQDQWIDCEVKVVQPCNNLYLYWSSGDIYKRLNLDDPCCEFEEIPLIKPVCVATVETDLIEQGGGLPNGVYQFAARAVDTEGNSSNWSRISNTISVADGDYVAGERSTKAINLQITGADNRDYHLLDLAVISTIDGITAIEQFATISSSSETSTFNYVYVGKTGREIALKLSDITTRVNRYIRGKNLIQYDNRIILYNLRPIANLDYQRQANNITAKYVNYIVPLEHAHRFKGLRPNENYWFAIRWNYEDGTSSVNYVIPGRNTGPGICDPYVDTSERLNTYLELDGLAYEKDFSVDFNTDQHIPDDLTEDEGTAVELEDDDLPTIGDEIQKELQELEYMDFEMGAALDCLCESAKDIASKGGLFNQILDDIPIVNWFTDSWNIEDDVIGAVALAQLLCMCENRTANLGDEEGGDDGNGGTSNPTSDPDQEGSQGVGSGVDGGEGDVVNTAENRTALEDAGVNVDLTFEQAGIGESEAAALLRNLESDCPSGNCGDGTTSTRSSSFSSESGTVTCDNGTCTNCGSSCSGGSGSGSGGGSSSGGGSCSNGSCSANTGYLSTAQSPSGRRLERPVDFLRNRIAYEGEMLYKEAVRVRTGDMESKDIYQGGKCDKEGYKTCVGNVCYECRGSKWYQLNNADSYATGVAYSKDGPVKDTTTLGFEYEYAEDGCTILSIKPKKYTDGLFGGWKTEEVYPETLDCNCDLIYGPLAGENIRLHKVPSVSKEPHFVSFSSGVPNKYDQGNSEFKDTYMLMIGAEFDNITLPKNPPKPLCKHNPYSITFVERTESNKTVIGSGLGHSCFLGEIGGEPHAFAKHAANSFERFDRSIEPSGTSTFRGGGPIDVGAYFIHSPDFHMRRPPLNATQCLIELEYTGKGFRHGFFAEGEKPENWSQDRLHQKGTRQSINMNHYVSPGEPIVRQVKAMSKAPADSVVSKANSFTYTLCNLHRESGTYIELEGGLQPFITGDTSEYGGANRAADGASDRSFTGDTFTEALPIHNAKGQLMTFIRSLPNQYGSPISQAYIPLGLEAKGFQSSISGLVGDSFTGPMTYKRTALVSDKTNRIIARFVSPGGFDSSDGWVRRLLGRLMASMFRVMGIKNGGYIPKNQDPSDYIRVFGGLRDIHDRIQPNTASVNNPGEIEEGRIPPPYPTGRDRTMQPRATRPNDINFGDNYFPQNLKTQIVSYFNADVNLNYRELGNVDNGEVYYSADSSTLKGLKIDSTLPEETNWFKAWIPRWYSEWKENAKWKLLVQGVLTFVFTYIIGLWLIIKGVGYAVNGFQAAGGGTYGLQTIGALIAVAFGIVILFVGIAWMQYWVASDADNKLIEEFVGLKNIRPDRKNGDGSYSFNELRLRQFEDNYFKCDNTHNLVNKWEVSYGMSDPYNTCSCPTEYHNKILYSNRQDMDSQIDSWRNFKPNNSLEIPSDMGQIEKMFVLGNEVHAHTTDMLIKLQTGSRRLELDGDSVLLGNGSLFNSAFPVYGGVVEGYGGLSDPNAAEVSAYGYIFPDREARKWYQYSGGLPKPISNQGVRHFMDENMHLQILKDYPNFKLVDLKLPGGIGYSHGVDHRNERLLFTKIDYKPIYEGIILNEDGTTFSYEGDTIALGDPKYFDNKSFTLSYSLRNKSWTSFHNYLPFLYAWNRFDMYSFKNTDMWIHNVKGKFQTYYGDYYPFSVEYVVNDKEGGDAFSYTSTAMGTEAYKWKERDYINTLNTFDDMIAYNSHQSTGLIPFIDSDKLSLSERSMEVKDKVKLKFKDRIWSFKDISDRLIDKNDFIFDPKLKVGPKPINNDNIGKGDIKNNIFYDNYFANRLIFNKFDDVKLMLKRVETEVDYKSR